jgi:DUF971 family protein
MNGFDKICVIGDELAVSLRDGREMYFRLPMLRRACPCAACQGEPDALGRVKKPVVEYGKGAFELRRYELVGGYAVQFFWADGHSSGIYSLDYLVRLNALVDAH